jgi:hypothetical protein
VPEVAEELLELEDAEVAVLEFGVDLEAVTRLDDRRFADGFVIAQRDQCFTDPVRRERVPFSYFCWGRVMR